MAGGWYHLTNDEGVLRSPRQMLDAHDTGGDVVEAFEQLYGMAQWLAEQLTQANPGNLTRHEAIEAALEHWRDGVHLGGRAPSF